MIWKLTQRFTLVYLGEKLHDEYLTESIHHSLLEQVLGDRQCAKQVFCWQIKGTDIYQAITILKYKLHKQLTSFIYWQMKADFRLPYSRALANESRVKTGQVINIFLFYYM
ncbi:uncharacterized protein LOC113462538 isoform X1 [Phoenix dactylifera]|uniref:Uncharacterized protein LOC113462538 isoform X1 n=1 Tax=Phoenix dactylifera TaxID=42345 RepID=A0A8B8J2T1_PHODC|nr:uncharacterized protein LOC113462538 isoform X1 [Phoenix dactylifera]